MLHIYSYVIIALFITSSLSPIESKENCCTTDQMTIVPICTTESMQKHESEKVPYYYTYEDVVFSELELKEEKRSDKKWFWER